uniref:HAT C-terminal dimerisation domain-containing protein n=1 Tax=Solanum lycopersicum TaxID=4081 RepID=A0A3Q7HP48_SOLLC
MVNFLQLRWILLIQETEVRKLDFDVLLWWEVNSPTFPILSEMDRDVLVILISSMASECAFSTGDWLRSEPQPIRIEEDLDFLEKLEEDYFYDPYNTL